MKKIILFSIMAAVLGFTACSKEEPAQPETPRKGMILHATVAQPEYSKATFTDNGEAWDFDFAEGDVIKVTNKIISTEYTFTCNGTDFISTDAEPTSEPTRWYAYYPSKEVSLVGQTGKWEDLAKMYALIGSTFDTTGDVTGEEGLTISLNPAKLSFLKIENQKGSIDINVKDGKDSWVKGLTVSGSSFIPVSMLSKQTLLSSTENGTYFIAVPASRQLVIKDGETTLKSTSSAGLTAGQYYELTIEKPVPKGSRGKAYAKGPDCEVNWVKLWDGGPKFAEYNIGATSVTDLGGLYAWGGFQDRVDDHNTGTGYLGGETDTATVLWGRDWAMPSDGIWTILEKCDVERITINDVPGCKFTGRGDYSCNSIFLPLAGYYSKATGIHYVGERGCYWSSISDSNWAQAYMLSILPSLIKKTTTHRQHCQSVRPVYVGD